MIRRVVASLLQVLFISALTFFLFSMVPGDYVSAERLDPRRTEHSLQDWRVQHGLDRSWPLRYGAWLRSCARGNFGTSLSYQLPVERLIRPRILQTCELLIPAWILAWLFAVTAAMWGASGKRAFLEPVMTVAGMIPELIVAGALLWLAVSAHASLNQAWLPALALWFSIVPIVFLHAYGAFRSAFGETFVRLAESRGIPRARLWTKFVLPAAASPLLSLLGPSFAAAVGSSLAIEAVTGWPGLGQLFVEAVQSRDFEVVQAVVMLLAVTLTFLNLAADLILYRADLRIRLSYDRPR